MLLKMSKTKGTMLLGVTLLSTLASAGAMLDRHDGLLLAQSDAVGTSTSPKPEITDIESSGSDSDGSSISNIRIHARDTTRAFSLSLQLDTSYSVTGRSYPSEIMPLTGASSNELEKDLLPLVGVYLVPLEASWAQQQQKAAAGRTTQRTAGTSASANSAGADEVFVPRGEVLYSYERGVRCELSWSAKGPKWTTTQSRNVVLALGPALGSKGVDQFGFGLDVVTSSSAKKSAGLQQKLSLQVKPVKSKNVTDIKVGAKVFPGGLTCEPTLYESDKLPKYQASLVVTDRISKAKKQGYSILADGKERVDLSSEPGVRLYMYIPVYETSTAAGTMTESNAGKHAGSSSKTKGKSGSSSSSTKESALQGVHVETILTDLHDWIGMSNKGEWAALEMPCYDAGNKLVVSFMMTPGPQKELA